MKPWTQVVIPHSDIRRGHLDEAVFAADLSDVIARRGAQEYCDALTFFRKTYPTQGLVNLLAAVLRRLAGQGNGEAVIQIQTPFGGGKTHSLIALYHLIRHASELSTSQAGAEILARAELEALPAARVAAFVGTDADALQGRTPWGELAYQLGNYDLLKEQDERRRAPGKELLHRLLGDQPTLILMDEIAEYAVKAKDFRDQLMAFFQELTETVKAQRQCALVVTLPSSAPYGEEGARALHELQQIFKRVESIKTPVEGEEVYEVIRRRLFEEGGDPQEVRRTAEAFFETYQRLGDDLPKEAREPAYRERMRKAYPFHPELIDVLYERWSTFPDFQRTRGVLRLLAHVVTELYRTQHPAPLILPAHLNLANPAVRSEFLRHIGNEYQGVIAADIAGSNAKSERIDREMGSEYVRFGVAGGLARAIFFASFSGSEKRGVGIQRLRLALLQPGLPPAIIGDALQRLEEELWYLHVQGGVYWFSTQPNLNRILVEKEEAVKEEGIEEEIRARLERIAGSELRVILWPKSAQDVADTRELKLAVLSPEYPRQASATEAFVRELMEKCGQTFRTYRNTLLVLFADNTELQGVRQQVKRFLAHRAVAEDKALMRQLSEENRKNLESKLKDVESGITHRLISAYRYLAKAEEAGWRLHDLGLPTVGGKPSLAARVRDYLYSEEALLAKISPRQVLEKALRSDEKEKAVAELYEAYLKYPHLPMLANKEVLLNALAEGVQQGLFGVRVGGQVFFKERVSPAELAAEAVLVREPPLAAPPQPEPQAASIYPGGEAPQPPSPSGGIAEVSTAAVAPPSAGIRVYRLTVQLPWDKLSDFLRGVVTPLHQDGAEVNMEVTLEARAESGIKPTTLEQKVRETLHQIGAKILGEEKKG
ncbi:MAG: DUF499 domain-containing protein [Anaerolineales bacterium]|nr:DUF499 domain-containing protein [Anaerolineales bacterium]MDW8163057.1 DUF499 domain-containing protein [Anaerolineales bacterium]